MPREAGKPALLVSAGGGSAAGCGDLAARKAVALDPISGAPGTPESLFEGHYVLNSNTSLREYDVSPAGERFIMVKQPEDELPRRLVVVTHFFEVLKRLVAN